MYRSSVCGVTFVIGLGLLAGMSAYADGMSGGKTIPNADCERQKITTCKEEYQLDGKGGTIKTWVCTTTLGGCIATLESPGAGPVTGVMSGDVKPITPPLRPKTGAAGSSFAARSQPQAR